MKRYLCMLLVFLFGATGCADWINVEPENSLTFENYFKSEKDAQALLFTLQIKMRDMASPFAEYTELQGKKDFTEDQLPMMLTNFERYYAVISAADMIIDNAFRFPLAENVIRPYVLQACFAKGVAYFGLATDFGEAPIIKDSGTFKKYAKSSVGEVLDEAEKWAEKALEIPNYEDLKLGDLRLSKQFGSKGAATTLLAKIYAWRAGVEGKSEYWEKAEELCTRVIENKAGYYSLEADPEALCMEGLKRDSKESIWEYYRDAEEMKGVFYYSALTSVIGFPQDLNQNPKDIPGYFVTKERVREFYDEADGRREAYFWATDADSVFVKVVSGKTMVDTLRGTEGEVTGKWDNKSIKQAFLNKYRYPHYIYYDWSTVPNWAGMEQNVVHYRLADVILLRAECRVRQGKPNAVEDLNAIRKRAYGDGSPYQYPNADDVAKGLDKDLQLTIFREREKELALEGHRYYDARRNGAEYVQRTFKVYSYLTDQDIKEGALYMGIVGTAFDNNDLLRQNVYWNKRIQNE